MRQITHETDLCVVGGGLAGMCAALAAARHGARVALMQDRPVLGGNTSSECRVGVSGAERHRLPHLRETGILEELRLENLYRNPNQVFSIQDTVFYEKVRFQENLTLLLNCTCTDVEMDGDRVVSITGWQTSSETHHTVHAAIYADCTGDAILAPLTGAEFRRGREGRDEFGESIAPEVADDRTMGMSLLFRSREYDTPQPFTPPEWAYRFESCDELPYGEDGHRKWTMGYWWIELGGEHDSIHDTEMLRDELLKIVYGVWDHLKNHCPHRDELTHYALDWVGFVPGKRESRRYVGDHILTEGDVLAEGRFDDLVAYGGWTMDDHDPAGFWAVRTQRPATIFHPCPTPYGIPYRSLYSRNVANLMCAGRDISTTHAANSSTRVMGTCAVIGQAMGTAAAVAVREGVDPRGVGAYIDDVQQMLLRDDCYLPWHAQRYGELTTESRLVASQGDPEPLRDGVSRQVGDDPHCWTCRPGDHVAYLLPEAREVREATLVLDSAMERVFCSNWDPNDGMNTIPPVMPRAFRVEGLIDGQWRELARVADNHQRQVRVPIGRCVEGVRYALDACWGEGEVTSRVYAFYLD